MSSYPLDYGELRAKLATAETRISELEGEANMLRFDCTMREKRIVDLEWENKALMRANMAAEKRVSETLKQLGKAREWGEHIRDILANRGFRRKAPWEREE